MKFPLARMGAKPVDSPAQIPLLRRTLQPCVVRGRRLRARIGRCSWRALYRYSLERSGSDNGKLVWKTGNDASAFRGGSRKSVYLQDPHWLLVPMRLCTLFGGVKMIVRILGARRFVAWSLCCAISLSVMAWVINWCLREAANVRSTVADREMGKAVFTLIEQASNSGRFPQSPSYGPTSRYYLPVFDLDWSTIKDDDVILIDTRSADPAGRRVGTKAGYTSFIPVRDIESTLAGRWLDNRARSTIPHWQSE
jgi:hypothetical protein